MPVKTDTDDRLAERVTRAAEAALSERGFVTPIDVLVGLRWLLPDRLAWWRQGRVAQLDDVVQVGPAKLAAAMALLESWAGDRGLQPREVCHVARSRDRRPLRFSQTGREEVERAYRTPGSRRGPARSAPARAISRSRKGPGRSA